MTLSCIWSIVAWSSGVLSLIAPRQRQVGVSRCRCLGNISAASLDVSHLATPEARRRSELVSLRPSTLFSRGSQRRRWCGFKGKCRLDLPGYSSTKFTRPLGCFLLLCRHLLRLDDSCRVRRQIHLSFSIPSGGNKFAKGLAFVLFVPRLAFD